jgi:hypothetical protein
MSKVEISQDSDVTMLDSTSDVVVIADYQVEVIQELEQGPPGPMGPQGAPSTIPGPKGDQGIPGNTILYGTVDPVNSVGLNGNFYINTTTNFMFGPKANDIWPAGTSIVGPQGTPGNTVLYGAADPVAGTGVDGNFYINTTSHFMFGPKAGGAWPAGTSLVGPQGPQGVTGSVTIAVSDTPPVGVPDNTLWWESDTGILYVRYNDGDSTQWVAAFATPSTDLTGAVRYDVAQSLSAAQQAQARANVSSQPALSTNTIYLAAPVSFGTGAGWVDVLSFGSLPAGTYWIFVKIGFKNPSASATAVVARLTDGAGAAQYDSTNYINIAGSGARIQGTIGCFLTLGAATTIKVQGLDAGAQNAQASANEMGLVSPKDTSISWMKVA